jgi:hypothetical protein
VPKAWRRTATLLGALLACAGAVGGGAWAGCSIYDPSLLLPATQEEAGGPVDVVVEEAAEGVDAAPDAPNPCPEVFPPTKPSADDPSDAGDDISFVAALHTLDVGIRTDGSAPPPYGYDLDHVFTCCAGGPESCKPPVTGAAHCDEDGGRDNAGGQLLATLALVDPSQISADTITQNLQRGVYSVLLEIKDYNGQANDTQVVAGMYTSPGVEAVGDAAPAAKWDGTDLWTVDEAFVLNAPDASPILPNHFDAYAYVSGGVLVMQINFPLSLGSNGVTVELTGGIITARISSGGNGQYRLEDGQVAGRWSAAGVLKTAQSLSLGGQSICPGSFVYQNVKTQICSAADIVADPTQDNKGATCDALSIGFGFTADPANMGYVVATTPKPNPCAASADAAPDDCTKP